MHLNSSLAAIITGGASGLGEATARRLAAHGVRITILDMQEARGASVAAEIGGLFCLTDVTSEASVEAALAKAAAAHGTARILVNCAGIATGKRTVSVDRATGAFVAHDMELFRRAIGINLIGTFQMITHFATALAAAPTIDADGQRGVIINTASVAAEDGQIGQAAYAASKAGVVGLTLPVARDLSGYGIRVMAILPGLFTTPMFDGLNEAAKTSLAASVPFPSRLGRPEEYAALVQAICENDMLNGTTVRLDGAIRLAMR